jgi:hypothetical protein
MRKFTNLALVKRIAAILLMTILLFNWCGYRLMTSWLEGRADKQLVSSLDANNYDESQLISVKVPSTHLSYYNSSQQFERVDGKIQIGAITYNYVKRRIFNDSVELLCIPNRASMQLQTAKNEFFKLVNDLQASGQSKKAGSHSDTSKSPSSVEYYAVNDIYVIGNLYFTSLPSADHQAAALSSSYLLTTEQPPDLLSGQC